ncbi:helix-turn-helix domain-containing protein [Variovorax sp. LjRoot175]|uniref:helix-turn-helix domain-containing protein n=1 Tax=Variovorax sp. LjRoot175 TaxID=3342276 RepID=UPI003ECDB688
MNKRLLGSEMIAIRSTAFYGERIRALRTAKRWTQVDLARRANVSQSTVIAVERGDSTNRRMITHLAGVLGADFACMPGRVPRPTTMLNFTPDRRELLLEHPAAFAHAYAAIMKAMGPVSR